MAGLYEDAVIAGQHGDFAQARRLFRELADGGEPRAQFNLGRMDSEGQGAPQDCSSAARWFQKASEQGNPGAQFNLGLLYHLGCGVPHDDAAAASWYLKAAQQGYAGAQVDLAAMLASGQAMPLDKAQARAWYRKAAEQGDAEGQYRLALMYIEEAREAVLPYAPQVRFRQVMNSVFGDGRWRETGGYRTPGRENQLRAQGAETVPAGMLSRHSLGTPEAPGAYDIVVDGMSPDQAALRLRRSGGEFKSLFPEKSHGTQGAHLHVEPYLIHYPAAPPRQPPRGHGPGHDLKARVASETVAAPDSTVRAAQLYDQAVTWLRKAAEQGNAAAQVSLGRTYAAGDGVRQNLVEASKWLGLAASSGSPMASEQRAVAIKLRDKIAARLAPPVLPAADPRRTNESYLLAPSRSN